MDFKRRNTNEGDAAGGSGSAWKKPRGPSMHDDEGFGPTPDEDFGDDMFDPDEGADLEPDLDLDADHHFDGGVDEKTFKQASWIRPPLVMPNPATDSVVFQQIDADYYVGDPIAGMPGYHGGQVPIVRLFGVNREGNSVMAHVHGFTPYFFSPVPEGFDPGNCERLRKAMNAKLETSSSKQNKLKEYVVDICIENKQSIQGYKGNSKSPFFRISSAQPRLVPTLRGLLEGGIDYPGVGFRAFTTYESNIAYVLRFMIDTNIVGANWVECPPGQYTIRNPDAKLCHTQLEVDISFEKIISHRPENEWSDVAPLRILSFDIECCAKKGHFPDADQDPVIQIANMVTIQGQDAPIIKNIFTLKSCANIPGAQVLSFEKEDSLLEAWRHFIVKADPDIITGYNIVNFDLPYLMNRASALKVKRFPFLGRVKSTRSIMKNTTFSSKAYGTRESKAINIDGRVQFDMIQVIQREHKLSSYSLNAVSSHFLGEQKEDVHHSIIADLYNGDAHTRKRLATYCLKDAYLPQRLMDKLMALINSIEMARVTGVPMSYLLTRGQQIKVVSQLYRQCLNEEIIIPTVRAKGSDEKYEGATVIEPKRGYYETPIATLDFASLYPSIMMAHNLCYTTLLSPSDRDKMNPDDYVKTPCGDTFVKSNVRKGILPRILEDLIAARQKAKAEIKKATDPVKKAVLDGRQLALKISANSVYGFTGATVGQLPCLEISASVTSFGRLMIEQTAKIVKDHYTISNGYKFDADVIYGDTDSVMVKFGPESTAECMALGKEAAAKVSEHFIRPIKLEFEKVYFPYLLINKKRYAGLLWTNPDKYDKLDAKGIETVRRDNCPLVRKVVSTSLQKILIERNVAGAVSYVKNIISDLLKNKLDLSELVITKALSKSGDDYAAKQAHVELAERMRKRDAGSAPAIGDRVPYVIIKAAKDAKAYEKSEDPIWVLENSIPLDTEYYLKQQLSNPLIRIFEPIMGEQQANELLVGDHTRSISISTPTIGGIMRFTKKTLTCMGCKVPLTGNDKTLCAHCKSRECEIYQSTQSNANRLEEMYNALWTQCQRCQDSLHQEVLCTNRDCPIFYMRKKVQKDLNDAQSQLDRFDLSW
eukprot:TRINITY_DN7021_c0_g1_i1.p1 TRINITY_DN7021_c0_g1~~TRINITY_DN7021_c0_g1_i1.p1  ORF type:complete len:1103 (-),score=239.27 TRINITY_DN7021_c0_g1_i1:90-3398(-)